MKATSTLMELIRKIISAEGDHTALGSVIRILNVCGDTTGLGGARANEGRAAIVARAIESLDFVEGMSRKLDPYTTGIKTLSVLAATLTGEPLRFVTALRDARLVLDNATQRASDQYSLANDAINAFKYILSLASPTRFEKTDAHFEAIPLSHIMQSSAGSNALGTTLPISEGGNIVIEPVTRLNQDLGLASYNMYASETRWTSIRSLSGNGMGALFGGRGVAKLKCQVVLTKVQPVATDSRAVFLAVSNGHVSATPFVIPGGAGFSYFSISVVLKADDASGVFSVAFGLDYQDTGGLEVTRMDIRQHSIDIVGVENFSLPAVEYHMANGQRNTVGNSNWRQMLGSLPPLGVDSYEGLPGNPGRIWRIAVDDANTVYMRSWIQNVLVPALQLQYPAWTPTQLAILHDVERWPNADGPFGNLPSGRYVETMIDELEAAADSLAIFGTPESRWLDELNLD